METTSCTQPSIAMKWNWHKSKCCSLLLEFKLLQAINNYTIFVDIYTTRINLMTCVYIHYVSMHVLLNGSFLFWRQEVDSLRSSMSSWLSLFCTWICPLVTPLWSAWTGGHGSSIASSSIAPRTPLSAKMSAEKTNTQDRKAGKVKTYHRIVKR